MTCHACGAPLPRTARFCHKCGAAVAAPSQESAGWQAGLPWAVAGAAGGALLPVVALRVVGSSSGGGMRESGGVGDGPPPASGLPAPDISQMSPEQQARRLFDRVVGLAERGAQDSVRFFLPMALGAYAQLPALDLDARYDIGVLHLAGGDGAGALAQADTILRTVPTHLYGFMLRARAYELVRDAPRPRRAYAGFLRYEAAERTRRRPEYAEHQNTIDGFRSDIGVLHLAGGDGAGALAQADTILRTVPTHLYGFMLRARAYELVRDAPRARRAYAGFLRYETAERTRRRPEYAEHQNTIDAFHADAVRATGGQAS